MDSLTSIGCIEPLGSLYSSRLVLVRKKDGGLRVYVGLNKKTISDWYPIPQIDNLIDTISQQKGKFFTLLDPTNVTIRSGSQSRQRKRQHLCHKGGHIPDMSPIKVDHIQESSDCFGICWPGKILYCPSFGHTSSADNVNPR